MRTRFTIALTMSLAALCGAPHSQAPSADAAAAQAPASAAQQWTGVIELPGGMSLEFLATFTPPENPDAPWTGTLSIPAQGMADEPLRDIQVTPGSLKFTWAAKGAPAQTWAIFDANLNAQGEVTSATLKQQGQEFAVKMKRRDPATDDEENALRPQTPRPPYPYTQRELSILNPADETRLVGTLIVPGMPPEGELVSRERHPAVIFITGSGAQDRDETIFGHKPFLVIADHLARNGIASLRMDDRGVGGSTGNIATSTVYDLASDIKAAFGALKVQPDIDPTRIGLIGHSEGGAIAPLVAADVPEIRFIVLMAGTGVPGREVMTHQAQLIGKAQGMSDEEIAKLRTSHAALMDVICRDAAPDAVNEAMRALIHVQLRGQELPEEQMAQLLEAQMRQLNSPWMRSFLTYDPRVPLGKARASVLALNGSLDLQVDPEQNLPEIEKTLRAAGNKDVTAMKLPGLNHLFQEATTGHPAEYATIRQTVSPLALNAMTQWLRKQAGLGD